MFDEYIDKIPKVDSNLNYWMVRTNAGKYFNTFLANNIVAMGNDYLNPKDLLEFSSHKDEFSNSITPIILKYIDTQRPGVTVNQFFRFYHEIKKGDIVIIPSESSNFIAIGTVISDKPEELEGHHEDLQCKHNHIRKVKWIVKKSRMDFNPNFIALLFSHNAIVDANEYKEYINGVMYDFYIKDEIGHLILTIRTTNKINAIDLFLYFSNLLSLSDAFFDNDESKNISAKVNLNSPGIVELMATSLPTLVFIAIIATVINGGKFKLLGVIEIENKGLLGHILNFIKEYRNKDNRIIDIKKSQKSLEVQHPKEIEKIIDEQE